MADLAKRDTPLRSRPQSTFRRETTMPRQATDLPELGVFASIRRPDMSGAKALQDILGLAVDTGTKIAKDMQDNRDQRDAADAVLQFQTGQKDDKRFAKSRAYRDAWQLEGTKKLAIDISQEVTDGFNARLNDPDNPPTMEDLDGFFEQTLQKHLFDEAGKPLDFITPEAKKTLGTALARLKAELMPKAAAAIKTQQDNRLFETTLHNMLFEYKAGQNLDGSPVTGPTPTTADLTDSSGTPDVKAQQAKVFKSFGEPTGKLPLPGKITATLAQHKARGSMGVDIDGKMGDPISAPAGGSVTVGHDARSGNYVVIDHGNGTTSSYSHLSKTNLKDGDIIKAGETLGFVGNTGHTSKGHGGDGSHLHWRVKVKGKDVDPLTFAFTGGGGGEEVVVATGQEPKLDAPAATPEVALRPGFNVEKFMSALPPSVNKGEAKGFLMEALIAEAADSGNVSILNGLEDSVRKDGTPSFTPSERLKIVQTRETLTERNRVKAERAERQMQQDNGDKVLEAFAADNPPSISWLAEQGRKGLLDDGFVASMIGHVKAEQKAEQVQARQEARIAAAESDNEIDAMVYAMEAERRAGILKGASYQDDLRRFESGELGEGKKAAARLKRLVAASKTGQSAVEQNPQFARYAAELETRYKPRKASSGNLLLARPQGDLTQPEYEEMVSFYEEKVHSGTAPGEAFREAVKTYAKKKPQTKQDQLADIRQQIADLRKKREGR